MRHFRRFFRCSFRPEVVSDVISGVVVDPTGMKVRGKKWVILGQTVLEIYECLTLLRTTTTTTTPADGPNDNRAKLRFA